MKDGQNGRGASTRETILAAARKVFATRPYHAASLRDMATAGGFYHGLIRYHFPSKAAIFEAVVATACQDLKQANRNWLREVRDLNPRDGLSRYLDRFIEHHRTHPETFQIIVCNLPQQAPDSLPGYEHLLELLSGSRADFETIHAGLFSDQSATWFLESFNALIIHYLGAAASQAALLDMDPTGEAYLAWVKKAMMFVFLPVLEQAASEASAP